MQHIDTDEVDSWISPASVKRPLSEELGTEHIAMNYYELAPGETFGFGYHRHPDQEEIFYLLSGVATFETEDGEIELTEGEAIRFAPGEWQLGRNDSDQRLRALALGAPETANETELQRRCESCGDRQPARIERATDEDALLTVCAVCDTETGRYD